MKEKIYETYLMYNNIIFIYDRKSRKLFKAVQGERKEVTDEKEALGLLISNAFVIKEKDLGQKNIIVEC